MVELNPIIFNWLENKAPSERFAGLHFGFDE
jgi:hypothetical protein